ncbi:hypothetical protein IFT48_04915 [Pseudomonas fluorescens]|uniref:hypothetical protein n=1 Tax=Pseudomonas TaxID=286 RepID=UPI000F02F791|nr:MULTISPECIES: hypothetical protein [Pseudomonas]MBD8089316.1 hypothetical protein [Pseudomonas fluorescens]MBD8615258.1 hypothetical protein [Pseudomonas putida]
MFALIIAIIAIALTVYLAVSTLFYGGDGLSNGSARAIASTFINQGQQISGAHVLYKNDNAGLSLGETADGATAPTAVSTELTKLVTEQYLSSVPTPPAGLQYRIAKAFNADGTTVPKVIVAEAAAGESIANEVCDIIADQSANSTGTFGCVKGASAEANKVWYRI